MPQFYNPATVPAPMLPVMPTYYICIPDQQIPQMTTGEQHIAVEQHQKLTKRDVRRRRNRKVLRIQLEVSIIIVI
eukprot:UN03737